MILDDCRRIPASLVFVLKGDVKLSFSGRNQLPPEIEMDRLIGKENTVVCR